MGAQRRRRNWGVTAVTLAAAAVIVGGCQPKQPPAPTTRESTVAQADPPAATQPAEADASSAEALARKAEEWAKMLEALRAKREAAATRPAATQPVVTAATEPAVVAATQPVQAPAVAKNNESASPGTALVFTAPTTQPMVTISPPAAPTTQAIKVAAPEPKVVVKDALAERVEAAVKSAPRDAAANLEYQLVRLLREQPAPDVAALTNLSAEDREAISAVLDGLANFRAGLRNDPNAMASKKVRPLVEMGDRLRAQADLQVGGTALCSAVRGYGAYEALKGSFVAGRENRALVYCEVNGFASRLGEDNLWETKLTQELVLYRGESEAWKKGKPDEIVDRCRNKRRDFYTMNLLSLPANLPAGSYTLKVTVIDQIASRVAETTYPVTIAAGGGAVAAGK